MVSMRDSLWASVFGMFLAVASALAGMLAWEHGEELARLPSEGILDMFGLEYTCFALCCPLPLFILGAALVIGAARTAPRPPDPPTSF